MGSATHTSITYLHVLYGAESFLRS